MDGLFFDVEAVRTASQHTADALSRSLSDGRIDAIEASRRRRGRGRHAIEAMWLDGGRAAPDGDDA